MKSRFNIHIPRLSQLSNGSGGGYVLQPHETCPRFEECSVNKCPLHKDYHKLKAHSEDKERVCKLSKRIRRRIGKKHGLQWEGLKPRELRAVRQKQDKLTREVEIKTAQTKLWGER